MYMYSMDLSVEGEVMTNVNIPAQDVPTAFEAIADWMRAHEVLADEVRIVASRKID